MIIYRVIDTETGESIGDCGAPPVHFDLPDGGGALYEAVGDLRPAHAPRWRLDAVEVPDPPVRRLVPKSVVVDRLQQAGLLAAARSALDAADLYTRERWNTRVVIYADDPKAHILAG